MYQISLKEKMKFLIKYPVLLSKNKIEYQVR